MGYCHIYKKAVALTRVSLAMAEPKFWKHTEPLEELTNEVLTLSTLSPSSDSVQ